MAGMARVNATLVPYKTRHSFSSRFFFHCLALFLVIISHLLRGSVVSSPITHQILYNMTPLEAAKFADLHDDVLREIADYLDLRRDDLSVRPPTHECPRAVLSRYHPPLCQTVTPPTHNQLRKSRRDLRAVCSRTLRAVAPDIAIKIETTEALMSWANTSETKAAVIS